MIPSNLAGNSKSTRSYGVSKPTLALVLFPSEIIFYAIVSITLDGTAIVPSLPTVRSMYVHTHASVD